MTIEHEFMRQSGLVFMTTFNHNVFCECAEGKQQQVNHGISKCEW